MNIKSLLLGSAAALVAVSGARAADAVVVAEPEPVEYVRVCDVYGTSFYYIPGTEICLKVGGYVRYDIGAGELFGDVSSEGNDTWHKRGRFALRMDARTETELGTLQGLVQINFNWATSSAGLVDGTRDVLLGPGGLVVDPSDASNSEGIERAWVKLGGFMIGVEDSLFDTFSGYASGVVNDGLIPYGPFTTHQISYTFDAGNGFSAFAGVEEGNNADSAFDEGEGIIQDYTPHILAGAKYASGIWGASVTGAWDSVQEEFSVKGRIDVTPSDMFSLFVMGAWTDDNGDGISAVTGLPFDSNGGNFYATWGGDWGLWAGGAVHINDRLTLNAEFGLNELSDYSADVDLNVTVVPGFVVTPGIGFRHGDGDPLSPIAAEDQWGGYLRTQFTF
jgi:hypothetical protein